MLRRSFLKWLGVAPAVPVDAIKVIGGKQYKVVKMGQIKEAVSGMWPFEKGEHYEVNDAYLALKQKEFKCKMPEMIALKNTDGNSHLVNRAGVQVFDKYVEIKEGK